MLSPVEACCGDKELSMDEVRSEGLRQWNMEYDTLDLASVVSPD